MKKFFRLLLVDSAKDLMKYKSFLLLIFFLMIIDKIVKHYSPRMSSFFEKPDMNKFFSIISDYLFLTFPGQLQKLITDYRTFLILIGLFAFKMLTSLWPSSDMRRMHREERGKLGIFGSLASIRWEQVLWDAIAVLSICIVALIWCAVGYFLCLAWWKGTGSGFAGILFVLLAFLIWPLTVAGFSYSSKLAVISRGNFRQKLALFYQLFLNKRILLISWAFYTVRMALEVGVLGIFPILANLYIGIWVLRIVILCLVACPVYAYLKMVSFKVFLELYRNEELVYQEYTDYYKAIE